MDMQNLISILPQTDNLQYSQVYSQNGCLYFLKENTTPLIVQNLNWIDAELRVICQILLSNGFLINQAIMPKNLSIKELNALFSLYKDEEKQINVDGIKLRYLDGKQINYQNQNYKFDYHSRKLFCLKHNDYMATCSLIFASKKMDMADKIKVLVEKYNSWLITEKYQNLTFFKIFHKNDYMPLVVSRMREITEDINTLLTNGENMAMYKSGQNEKPSLTKYSVFIEQYGAHSTEAQSYFAKFANDLQFAVEAQKIKDEALNKEANKEQK